MGVMFPIKKEKNTYYYVNGIPFLFSETGEEPPANFGRPSAIVIQDRTGFSSGLICDDAQRKDSDEN